MSANCDKLCVKLRQCCGVLHKFRHFLSKKQLLTIFSCLALSYIHYFAIVCSSAKKMYITKISSSYNNCGSIIHNCFVKYINEYDWIEYELLTSRIKLYFLHKVISCKFSPTLLSILNEGMINKKYNLRNNDRLQVKRFNKSYGSKAFAYWAPKMWNALPSALRTTTSHRAFKELIVNSD